MKLIIRADDYGYTVAHNKGTIETIKNGITTSVDLMLDTPGTEDAIERIKEFPWISIGWHAHFWGIPVLDPELIPSMVNESGRFKFRKNAKLKETVVFEEAIMESRAQIEKCIRLLGKAPDTAWIFGDYPFERARKQICDEYGIKYNFARTLNPETKILLEPEDQYKDLNIVKCKIDQNPLNSNSLDQVLENEIAITAFHPGYLDDYIVSESSLTEGRPKDVELLCSDEITQWIKENHVELINHRDALYGTNEYQNYLKVINSGLTIKN